jgi:hypothetical protein
LGGVSDPITIGIPTESLEAIASRATPVPATDCSAGWAVSSFGSFATPAPASRRLDHESRDEAGAWLSTACEDERRSRSAGVSAIEALPRSSS